MSTYQLWFKSRKQNQPITSIQWNQGFIIRFRSYTTVGEDKEMVGESEKNH